MNECTADAACCSFLSLSQPEERPPASTRPETVRRVTSKNIRREGGRAASDRPGPPGRKVQGYARHQWDCRRSEPWMRTSKPASGGSRRELTPPSEVWRLVTMLARAGTILPTTSATAWVLEGRPGPDWTSETWSFRFWSSMMSKPKSEKARDRFLFPVFVVPLPVVVVVLPTTPAVPVEPVSAAWNPDEGCAVVVVASSLASSPSSLSLSCSPSSASRRASWKACQMEVTARRISHST
mmetsp:Transcript_7191/g.23622  ORF Transcript_7191/g.23622 Transcript_7191/m.23622 type:complete len:239 (+) Transcript_7191:244-960(+)